MNHRLCDYIQCPICTHTPAVLREAICIIWADIDLMKRRQNQILDAINSLTIQIQAKGEKHE